MKSMTGFGRGVARTDNGTGAVVEISAVNSRKQLEIRLSAPRELSTLDQEIRGIVQKKLMRGNLNIAVSYHIGASEVGAISPFDQEYAALVAAQLTDFARNNQLLPPTMGDLLLVPGVLKITDNTVVLIKPLVMNALDIALQELDAMREREGDALKIDLTQRGKIMAERLASIMAREGEAVIAMKNKLLERIAKLGMELSCDDERLAKELAFYVDKTDITEETVRLKSHLTQYAALMEQDSDVGRNLDFLCQEMGREVNTLSAKTSDTPISQLALEMKIELSKIKEQIMNVE